MSTEDNPRESTSRIVKGILVKNYLRHGLDIENPSKVKIYIKFVNINRILFSKLFVINSSPLSSAINYRYVISES